MFDQELNKDSDSDDVKDENKSSKPVVARPTTKPTDKTRQTKSSYTFWKENDKAKLDSFPQFKDETIIKPKKIDDPETLKKIAQENEQVRASSSWNKAGTTW